MGKLFLIPTVIADSTESQVIAPQVREVIGNLGYFLVENIRTARRYISSLKLGLVIEELEFELLDKKTKPEQIKKYLQTVLDGKDVGIISESGCPGVADPGAVAVSIAHDLGIQVVPLVGPSSILLALMGSGFSGQSFAFSGYLPIDKREREQRIKSLEKLARGGQTQIFMDTPYRNQKLLEDLLRVCNGDTMLSIAKGITSSEEIILTKKVKDWKSVKIDLNKVPTIFSIYF